MDHVLQRSLAVALTFAAMSCGSAPYEARFGHGGADSDGGVDASPSGREPDRADGGRAAVAPDPSHPVVTPEGVDSLRLQGRVLDAVMPRLYFVGHAGDVPAPDAVTLRSIGSEAVTLTGAALFDDLGSPFGVDGARHFAVELAPGPHVIAPGGALVVGVRFLGDTMELTNAILELYTDAQNRPIVVVALTGKLIAL